MDDECSPGGQSDEAWPDLSAFVRYVQDVQAGRVKHSIAAAARAMGVSRARVYRMMSLSQVSEDELDEIVDALPAGASMTAISDAVKRRTGKAREYEERCPHCGETLRVRHR